MVTLMQARAELLAALRNEPWGIEEVYLLAMTEAILRARSTDDMQALSAARPQRPVSSGDTVDVLNITGVISPKPSLFSMWFGGTALTDFQAELEAAVNNPRVAGIVINVDSPGGSVALVQETAAQIRAARAIKPIVAVANTTAASAAYWLASQATEVVSTPSGAVGSIGIYTAHTDWSGAEEKEGLKTTLISAGKYKTEGNPFEPLSKEAQKAMQANVDSYYLAFAQDVAAGRGVSESAIVDGYGQGRTLRAEKALAAGMIDRIETLDQAIARMTSELGGKTSAAAPPPQVSALQECARFEIDRFTYQQGSKSE